ncbi:peptidoglycan-binding protein [Streptomyces sp. F63]|nr:peptidoglycan-binding protein [Streptomyces sp. F63]
MPPRVLPGLFPPMSGAARRPRRSSAGRRGPSRAAGFLAAGGGAAVLAVLAVLLLTQGGAGTAPGTAAPPAPAPSGAPAEPTAIPQPPTEADPEAGGVLEPGDSGPAVSDLQDRLSKIPNVYTERGADGQYDDVLTEAVARFQLWYGIRGDEEGVYGDDTRRDLESRT